MKGIEIPNWFDIDRYKLRDTGREGMHGAMLAVLDRVPFYRIAAYLPASPTSVRGEAREAAQQALRHWSVAPYHRPDEETRAALLEALPAAPKDITQGFEKLLEKSEGDEREASQQALHRIVDSVAHLPADEQWREVEKGVKSGRQRKAEGGEGADLLEPVGPSWATKLFRYRTAAYMDLVIWGALVGSVPDMMALEEYVHLDRRLSVDPDYPKSWQSVAGLLERLKDRDLGFHTRIAEGGIFISEQRNADRRGKGRP